LTDEAEDTRAIFDTLINMPLHGGATYTRMDRYRDFRQVFGSEPGRRVLYELLAWCHMVKTSVPPGPNIDPYRTHVAEGERNIGIKLLGVLQHEPPIEQPTTANRKRQK